MYIYTHTYKPAHSTTSNTYGSVAAFKALHPILGRLTTGAEVTTVAPRTCNPDGGFEVLASSVIPSLFS